MKIMFPYYLETSKTFYLLLSEIFILPLQIFWHKPLTWLWLDLCYSSVLSSPAGPGPVSDEQSLISTINIVTITKD